MCDLETENPSDYLQFYSNIPNTTILNIMVCGGDGTIGWIMSEVEKIGYNTKNVIYSIIPFGTGNDLYQHVVQQIPSTTIASVGVSVNYPNNISSNINTNSSGTIRNKNNSSMNTIPTFNRNSKLLINPTTLISDCSHVLTSLCHQSYYSYNQPVINDNLLNNLVTTTETHADNNIEQIVSSNNTGSSMTTRKSVVTVDRWKVVITPTPKLFKRLLYNALFTQSFNTTANNISNTTDMTTTTTTTAANTNKKTNILNNVIYNLQQYAIQPNQNKIKIKMCNNYFGIGIDGTVSLAFAELRNQIPLMFFNKIVNKIWYAIVGFLTFLFKKKTDLSTICKLFCDDQEMNIPKGTQGIIMTNIGSYAGGSKLWSFSDNNKIIKTTNFNKNGSESLWKPQNAGDGVIEVIIYNMYLNLYCNYNHSIISCYELQK